MSSEHPFLQLAARTQFLTSAPTVATCPTDIGREVAFAGRSNAGKSSCINALTRQKQLARASKTPGRTQLINFFSLDADRRLVDLPGYGYARVAKDLKSEWQKHLADYLQSRYSLKGLILLMDVRHPLTDFDTNMLDWAKSRDMAVHCVLTKADKLNRGPSLNAVQAVRNDLKKLGYTASVQLFSALKMQGLDDLANVLGTWLDYPPQIQGEQADAVLTVEARARLT